MIGLVIAAGGSLLFIRKDVKEFHFEIRRTILGMKSSQKAKTQLPIAPCQLPVIHITLLWTREVFQGRQGSGMRAHVEKQLIVWFYRMSWGGV